MSQGVFGSGRKVRTKGFRPGQASTPTLTENSAGFQEETAETAEMIERSAPNDAAPDDAPAMERSPEAQENGAKENGPRNERADPVLGVLPPRKFAGRVALGGRGGNDFQMPAEALRDTVHLVCQSKGGTGKTYVAATLASFIQRHAEALDLYCFDLDSNRQSFSAFPSFCVSQFSEVSVDEDGHVVIDPTAFDGAFNKVLESIEGDSAVVIDTGAGGSFWALVQYLRELDYPTLVAESGKPWRFIIHVVISGSAVQESVDTIERLLSLVDSPYTEFVIWGNEYFGCLKDVYGEITRDYGAMFRRNINLPKITDTRLDNALQEMRKEGLSVTELLARPCTAIDKARITQYYYGNSSGKPGVFMALKQLDWTPVRRGEADAG